MAAMQVVQEIEAEVFTPAMQKGVDQALKKGHTLNDSIMAATNAHLNMLVELLGMEKAKEMLESQVSFLSTQKG